MIHYGEITSKARIFGYEAVGTFTRGQLYNQVMYDNIDKNHMEFTPTGFTAPHFQTPYVGYGDRCNRIPMGNDRSIKMGNIDQELAKRINNLMACVSIDFGDRYTVSNTLFVVLKRKDHKLVIDLESLNIMVNNLDKPISNPCSEIDNKYSKCDDNIIIVYNSNILKLNWVHNVKNLIISNSTIKANSIMSSVKTDNIVISDSIIDIKTGLNFNSYHNKTKKNGMLNIETSILNCKRLAVSIYGEEGLCDMRDFHINASESEVELYGDDKGYTCNDKYPINEKTENVIIHLQKKFDYLTLRGRCFELDTTVYVINPDSNGWLVLKPNDVNMYTFKDSDIKRFDRIITTRLHTLLTKVGINLSYNELNSVKCVLGVLNSLIMSKHSEEEIKEEASKIKKLIIDYVNNLLTKYGLEGLIGSVLKFKKPVNNKDEDLSKIEESLHNLSEEQRAKLLEMFK